jgi:hypothetical protein
MKSNQKWLPVIWRSYTEQIEAYRKGQDPRIVKPKPEAINYTNIPDYDDPDDADPRTFYPTSEEALNAARARMEWEESLPLDFADYTDENTTYS